MILRYLKYKKLGTYAHDRLCKTPFFQVDIFENMDGTYHHENDSLLTGIDNRDPSSKMDDFAQWTCHEIHPRASSENKQILYSSLAMNYFDDNKQAFY